GHGSRLPARSVRAARAARGSGGLAQCDSDAPGRRDCALAAERLAAMKETEEDLLDAARRGDEGAFSQLTAAHPQALHAPRHRVLRSVQDAEDALPEALFNAWRAPPPIEGRS